MINIANPAGTKGNPKLSISLSFFNENTNLMCRKVIMKSEEVFKTFVIRILRSMPMTPILKITRNKIFNVRYDTKVPMVMLEKMTDCFFASNKHSAADAMV